MKIKKIKVSNFKNFKNLDLELGNLNIVIGTNASGKSNFVEIFKFINRLERDTLANAISLSGGDALMNFNSSVNNLSIELLLETKYSLMLKPHRLNFTDFNYKFVLEAGRSKKIYHVSEETVEQHFSLLEGNGGTTSKKNKKLFDDESGKKGIITIHKDKNGVNSSILPESLAKEFNEKNFKLPSFPYPSDFLKKKDDPLLNKPLFFPRRWNNGSNRGRKYS